MTTTEPIYIFLAVACVLVMAVTTFECVRLWLERDRITDTELDSLPSTLMHGPDVDPLPEWVRVDGGEMKLYPFSGGDMNTIGDE